jgi:sporulation protein YlmC with PRC-barrel domain
VARTSEIVGDLTHRELLDVTGEKIGTVEDVRYDDVTASPKWLLVKTGLFGARRFVPATQVRSSKDRLTVSFTKERVKNAPRIGDDQLLSQAEEDQLSGYYGLDFAQAPTEHGVR